VIIPRHRTCPTRAAPAAVVQPRRSAKLPPQQATVKGHCHSRAEGRRNLRTRGAGRDPSLALGMDSGSHSGLDIGFCAHAMAQGAFSPHPIHMDRPFPAAARRPDRAHPRREAPPRPSGSRSWSRTAPRGRQSRHGPRRPGGADGYNPRFSIPGPLAVNSVLYRKMDYDPFKDLAPVCLRRRGSPKPAGLDPS